MPYCPIATVLWESNLGKSFLILIAWQWQKFQERIGAEPYDAGFSPVTFGSNTDAACGWYTEGNNGVCMYTLVHTHTPSCNNLVMASFCHGNSHFLCSTGLESRIGAFFTVLQSKALYWICARRKVLLNWREGSLDYSVFWRRGLIKLQNKMSQIKPKSPAQDMWAVGALNGHGFMCPSCWESRFL